MDNLSTAFKSLLGVSNHFSSEAAALRYFESIRWPEGPVSPYDSESKVYKCKGYKYKCSTTGKYFNVKKGTMFENSKIPLRKWLIGIWIMASHKKGCSSVQLATDLGITQKTAWFMAHRIRRCLTQSSYLLNGTVEVDETYIGGLNENRHQSKKKDNTQGRSLDKSVVLGMAQRCGIVRARHIENVRKNILDAQIKENIDTHATIYTDELGAYKNMPHHKKHESIKHKSHEYVRGNVHTNNIENFWSVMKRGIYGIYHYTSKKHLQKYIDEFAFRYNMRSLDISLKMEIIFSISDTRTKYNELTA